MKSASSFWRNTSPLWPPWHSSKPIGRLLRKVVVFWKLKMARLSRFSPTDNARSSSRLALRSPPNLVRSEFPHECHASLVQVRLMGLLRRPHKQRRLMTTVGEIEKITQARVIALFRDRLKYDYLGNWIDRPDNPSFRTPLCYNCAFPTELNDAVLRPS